MELGFWLRLLQTEATVTLFPLAALLQQIDALKALENVPLGSNLPRTLKRCMLTHFLNILSTNERILYHIFAAVSTA